MSRSGDMDCYDAVDEVLLGLIIETLAADRSKKTRDSDESDWCD
jgi:hypothetical protein